jgi:hypothetical protein
MDDFTDWALAASRYAGIDVDDDVVALAELIYTGVAQQLAALDGIDLERFPVRPIDPRHEPTTR